MKMVLITLAAAATFAFTSATTQASPQAQPMNTSYDQLAPQGTNLTESTTPAATELVTNRRGRRSYRRYRGRSYRPYNRSYRSYRSPYRYNRGYRGRYYNNYRGRYYGGRGGVGIYGRNFSFGFGF